MIYIVVSFLLTSFSRPISEKAMAPHSSTLAWKIPWMQEPGRLQSMRSLRVGHDWATSLSLFTSMHWRRKWQPTPVFLPGESQGRWAAVYGVAHSRTRLKRLSSPAAADLYTDSKSDVSDISRKDWFLVSVCIKILRFVAHSLEFPLPPWVWKGALPQRHLAPWVCSILPPGGSSATLQILREGWGGVGCRVGRSS